MNTLETLLVILDGQKLAPGYLTPGGDGTALGTVMALRQTMDPIQLISNPITPPALLLTPAYVNSLHGQDAIYLNAVDGNLDLSKHGPAYSFLQPV